MTTPRLSPEQPLVTDGGLETDLLFNHRIDLPEFAAFPLLASHPQALRTYFAGYVDVARRAGAGLVLETPTWRANPDWGAALGYDAAALDQVNREAVAFVREVLDSSGLERTVLSGAVGPRGDGYEASTTDAVAACAYHLPQVTAFAGAGADLVHALTITGVGEAVGIVRACREAGIPVAISFTVETDGRLPDGATLAAAVAGVEAEAPADWYGVNCAHPTHLSPALEPAADPDGLLPRLLTFFRPNASALSHAELDEMEELDAGDLGLLASSAAAVRAALPGLAVVGGCCGTDAGHVAALWGVSAD